MRVYELDTPALLVDLDIVDRNLKRVSDYAREHDLRLRPHTKTHKTPALARRQLASGAAGLTVAKIGEAEVMLQAEPADLLVAYPIIGRRKIERLVELARRTKITVAIDNLVSARQLSDAARLARIEFSVLAEADVGLGRTGVAPAEIAGFGRAVANFPHLKLEGIAFYPGHIKKIDDGGRESLRALADVVAGMVKAFRGAGLSAAIVSGGSTPALFESHCIQAMNEIRPGTYIFNDRNTVECGSCALEDCAAWIRATVVSARDGHAIIDGGSKTFSSDRLVTTGEPTFGYVREAPEAVFHRMMEEHGFLDLRRAEGANLQVGDAVTIIPNHICVAVNLHEQIYGVRGDEVEHIWKVEARGKLQ